MEPNSIGSKTLTTATRICGEQDCNNPTSRPNHPLCYDDYLELRAGSIRLCSDCQVTYQPAKHLVCRDCYQRQHSSPESGTSGGGESWDTALQQSPGPPPSQSDVKAIKTVRLNIDQHRERCTNHETNTTQYLVVPLLEGLGWDSKDPTQVVLEYASEGKRWHGNFKKVDIALFAGDVPIVFIEVKRLDRDYDPRYMEQLKDYASNMNSAFAVLTNGRYWLVSYVTDGVLQPRITVDVLKGSAEEVARTLSTAIGKTAMVNAGLSIPPPTKSPICKRITDALKKYRGREAQRRRIPPFTIFSDETIALIAEKKPTSNKQLQSVKGVGPTILKQHGAAILKIVTGQRPS